jgi:hypothetical protein
MICLTRLVWAKFEILRTMMKSAPVITAYGTMWARNKQNIAKIPSSKKGGKGVYIMFDGSMPVYVGKGNIKTRIQRAKQSEKRAQFWDRFSWYAIGDQSLVHDIESLILRMLPPVLRMLNKQEGKFKDATRVKQANEVAEVISRKSKKPRHARKRRK